MDNFSIDPETGNLIFHSLNAVVERMSKWSAFPEALKLQIHAMRNMGTGWSWPLIAPLLYEGIRVGVSFGYHNRRLEMLNFSMPRDPNPGEDGPVWPTQAESMEEEKILRQAMGKQLGVSLDSGGAQFKWGSAYCLYHPRDDATSAGVNYTFFR